MHPILLNIIFVATGIVTLMFITLLVSWIYNKNGLLEFKKDSLFYKVRFVSNWLSGVLKANPASLEFSSGKLKSYAEKRSKEPITLCGAFWSVVFGFTVVFIIDIVVVSFLLTVSPAIGLIAGMTYLGEYISDKRRVRNEVKENKYWGQLKLFSKEDTTPVSAELIKLVHQNIKNRSYFVQEKEVLKQAYKYCMSRIEANKNFEKTGFPVIQDFVFLVGGIPESKIFLNKKGNMENTIFTKKSFREDWLYFWKKYQLDDFLDLSQQKKEGVWGLIKDVYHQKLCPRIVYKE